MAEELKESESSREMKLLPTWYYNAFALRFLGFKYEEIAKQTGKSLSVVQKLFYKNGALFKYWRDYVEHRKAEQIEESNDMLFSRLPDSVRRLIMHAQQGKGLVSLEAIKTQMQYTMGKPEDRIKLDATVGIFNFTDWALKQAESIKQKQNANGAVGSAREIIDPVSGAS